MSRPSGSSSPPEDPGDDPDLATVRRITTFLLHERQKQGLTLRRLGQKMKVDFSHLGRAERGETQPSLMIILRWCRALEIPFDEMVQQILKNDS